MADGIAGGLVAGDHEQDEERGDFGRRKPLAVDFGLHQAGGQIVSGIAAAILGQCGGVGTDIHCHLDELIEVGGQVGVTEAKYHVRPVKDPLMVFLGNAHHVADDLQGEWTGQFGHHFALSVWMVLHHRRHQPAGALANRLLGAGHHPRREGAAHDVAQPRMPRVVERDHRPEVLGQLGYLVADGDTRLELNTSGCRLA